MTVKHFFYGLIISFAVPWLLVVAIPFESMRSLESVEFSEDKDERTGPYIPSHGGRMSNGSLIYAAENCASCHSQVIRPTYAGNDLFREGWAGASKDSRRESNAFDYPGEVNAAGNAFAHIGESRNGPDLSNVGYRYDGEEGYKDLLVRLYNPRLIDGNHKSTCQPNPALFKTEDDKGQVNHRDTLNVPTKEGKKVVPRDTALTLANYILSLRRDDQVPDSMNYNPRKGKK